MYLLTMPRKYVTLLIFENEKHTAKVLPDRFKFINDGQTATYVHYVGMFLFLPASAIAVFNTVSFVLSFMKTETTQKVDKHITLFLFALHVFNRAFSNLTAIMGGNSNTNQSLASKPCILLIKSVWHCFHLPFWELVFECDEVMDIVYNSTVKLHTTFLRAAQRKLSGLDKLVLKLQTDDCSMQKACAFLESFLDAYWNRETRLYARSHILLKPSFEFCNSKFKKV